MTRTRTVAAPMALLRRAVWCAAAAAVSVPAMAEPLEPGLWGGAGMRLEVTAPHAAVETECGHGRIDRPIELDAAGRFEAQGSYETHGGGPQRADGPPAPRARYRGVVDGDRMVLTIFPGAGPSLDFELKRGARVKLVRCL